MGECKHVLRVGNRIAPGYIGNCDLAPSFSLKHKGFMSLSDEDVSVKQKEFKSMFSEEMSDQPRDKVIDLLKDKACYDKGSPSSRCLL